MMLKTSYVCIKKSYSDVQIDGVNCQKYNPLVRNLACTIYESILSSEVTTLYEEPFKALCRKKTQLCNWGFDAGARYDPLN